MLSAKLLHAKGAVLWRIFSLHAPVQLAARVLSVKGARQDVTVDNAIVVA